MGKKRLREGDGNGARPADRPDDDLPAGNTGEEGDEEDFDMVDVEFEWFNFDPQVDFHGVKALLRQLFDVDSSLFNLSALADLVLSQPTIGSTVKVDGKDNDPYAMLTVLNTHEHGEREPMRGLVKYLAEKAQSNDKLSMIPKLLQGGNHVGLLLTERLVNVPAEIGPPMYSMLLDEVEAAVEDKEPYQFSHYLILSKTYREMESSLHDSGDRKRKKAREESSLYYFHPEDEILQKYALAYGGFDYTKEGDAVADSKRAFQEMGIKAFGHMILIEAGSRFEEAVKAVNEYLRPAQ